MTRTQDFDPNSFNLSASAADHFKENLRNKRSILGIRFSVEESSGCSGYTYSLDYVDKKKKDDLIFDCANIKVFIDQTSFIYLKGTKVDYVLDGVNKGIKFFNPNVKAVCGCGESFEVQV